MYKGTLEGKLRPEIWNLLRLLGVVGDWCLLGGPVAAAGWRKERDGIAKANSKVGV
jgi:hypothetical protein